MTQRRNESDPPPENEGMNRGYSMSSKRDSALTEQVYPGKKKTHTNLGHLNLP